MTETYKHISLASASLKKNLINVAIESGWKRWACDDETCQFLFVSSTGSVGTAQMGSIIETTGEAITLEQFITLIQNPPVPEVQATVLILNSGIRVQVDRLGWMLITHPRGVSNGYVFTPQESKQIFETLKSVQGHETFYSPSAFKENGNHSHE